MPALPREQDKPAVTDKQIWAEAAERLRTAMEAESENRKEGTEALQFRDGQQWPEDLYNQRKIDKRPSLTINHTNTFVRRVVNNMRQQRPRIKVHPVADGADVAKANVISGLIRHIENLSSAGIAYDTGGESAVSIGWGYWRVMADYADEDTFDQELKIVPIRNTFTVYIDPGSTLPTAEDAEWALISYMMRRQDYRREHPNAKNVEWNYTGSGDASADWETKDAIRLAEYYRIAKREDTLYKMSNGMALFQDEIDAMEKELSAAKVSYVRSGGKRVSRPSTRSNVEWFLLNGQDIVDRRTLDSDPLPDKWIPIIRCEGNVLDLNGRVRRKGMVKDLMDPARMYNYWRTMETELLALAPKAPFIVAAGQLDGHPEWKDANQKPYSALVYEPAFLEQPDGSKVPLPPPQRTPPVAVPAGAVSAAQGASQDLLAVAGMPHEPGADKPGAAISGVALERRQALSDIGHFQYYDNQTRAIAHTGRILLQLIPKYYSTQRMQRIIGEDGVPQMVGINQPSKDPAINAVKNDLTIGRYDVVMDTGPGYETKRIEDAETMIELLKTPLAEVISKTAADVVIRAMDFNGASLLADRLAPTNPAAMKQIMAQLPPEAQGVVQTLQAQLDHANQLLQKADTEIKYKGEIERGWMQVERDKFAAHTKDTIINAKTKTDDTHVKAQTAHNVAEIKAGAELLGKHVDGKYDAEARKDELEAAAKADRSKE